MAALLAPLLSMVTFSETPLACIALSKNAWLRPCRAGRSTRSQAFCLSCPQRGAIASSLQVGGSSLDTPSTNERTPKNAHQNGVD
jgi:hypothetical protein